MKIYCYSCGHPTQYAGEMPNFCQSCGKGLKKDEVKNYSTAAVNEMKEVPDDLNEEEDEYEDENYTLPNIDELVVEIRVDKPRSFTLGEIFREANNGENDTQRDGKKKK